MTCVVDLGRGHGQDSAAVFWYLDGKALDWLGQTGPGRGVQVKSEFLLTFLPICCTSPCPRLTTN